MRVCVCVRVRVRVRVRACVRVVRSATSMPQSQKRLVTKEIIKCLQAMECQCI